MELNFTVKEAVGPTAGPYELRANDGRNYLVLTLQEDPGLKLDTDTITVSFGDNATADEAEKPAAKRKR